MDTIYCCILMLAIVRFSDGIEDPRPGKCIPTRQYRMTTADCKWQYLTEVPQNLNKNIEILVASGNRIRRLTNNTFEQYTSLRYLYLDRNLIIIIEEGSFTPLTELEVLNLNTNGIKTIPSVLPYPLRKLYLADNQILEEISLKEAYNLQFLTLSDCNLVELPDFGVLPNLYELNLTGNPLTAINPIQLSSMCRLKVLHVPKSVYKLSNSECDCYKFLNWTTQKGINLGNYTCRSLENPENAGCYINSTEENKNYDSCLLVEPKIAMTKYIIVIIILLAVVFFVFGMICCCRRKKKRRSKSKARTSAAQNQEKKLTTLIL